MLNEMERRHGLLSPAAKHNGRWGESAAGTSQRSSELDSRHAFGQYQRDISCGQWQLSKTNVALALSAGLRASLHQRGVEDPPPQNTPPSSSDGRLNVSAKLPLMLGRYRCVEQIGEGTFSVLIRAVDTLLPPSHPDSMVAIKVMHTQFYEIGAEESKRLSELGATDSGAHSNIVRLHRCFIFEGHLCMVFELLSNDLAAKCGILHRAGSGRARSNLLTAVQRNCGGAGAVLGPMPLRLVRTVAVQILGAIGFLHSRGVIHADLKPENIAPCLIRGGPNATARNFRNELVCAAQRIPKHDGHSKSCVWPPLPITAGSTVLQPCVAAPTLDQPSTRTQRRGSTNMHGEDGVGWGCYESSLDPSRALRVRLLDLGNAMHERDASLYYDNFEVQSACYRAPEAVFGVPFSTPIDLWSLGCVLVELYTGAPLFGGEFAKAASAMAAGHGAASTITMLLGEWVDLLGPVPPTIFENGKFFSRCSAAVAPASPERRSRGSSCIATPPQRAKAMRLVSLFVKRRASPLSRSGFPAIACESGRDPVLRNGGANGNENVEARNDIAEVLQFADFVAGLLEYDPTARLSAASALCHPFVSKHVFPFSPFIGFRSTRHRSTSIAKEAAAEKLRSLCKSASLPRPQPKRTLASAGETVENSLESTQLRSSGRAVGAEVLPPPSLLLSPAPSAGKASTRDQREQTRCLNLQQHSSQRGERRPGRKGHAKDSAVDSAILVGKQRRVSSDESTSTKRTKRRRNLRERDDFEEGNSSQPRARQPTDTSLGSLGCLPSVRTTKPSPPRGLASASTLTSATVGERSIKGERERSFGDMARHTDVPSTANIDGSDIKAHPSSPHLQLRSPAGTDKQFSSTVSLLHLASPSTTNAAVRVRRK